MTTPTSGLSRRRVAAHNNNSSLDSSSSAPSSPSTSGFGASSTPELESWVPTLTLMDQVVIVGLKEKEGYLSFWNDCISYVLRGCILMELALRGRIGVPKESLTFRRSNTPLVDRPVEVRSTKHTGEVLLDEALRLMAPSSPTSISSWVDLLSGETWNLSKVGLQLKQVRERLAKGLVEKGVLRTERRSFLIFDMATHPVQDGRARNEIISKVQAQVLGQTAASTPMGGPPTSETLAPDARLRDALMVSACYAANVLENALVNQDFSERERAFEGADALLGEYGVWPCSQSSIQEAEEAGLPKECLEVACGVIAVFAKMDSVL